RSAGPWFWQRQQRSARCGCVPAQTLANSFARAFERAQVAVELERPIGSEFKRVEFKSELRRIDFFVELSGLLCLDNGLAQSGQPLLHDLGNAVANWSRAAVKLSRCGRKETAPAKYFALNVRQPDVAEFPKSQQALRMIERGFNHFTNEDRAGS